MKLSNVKLARTSSHPEKFISKSVEVILYWYNLAASTYHSVFGIKLVMVRLLRLLNSRDLSVITQI